MIVRVVPAVLSCDTYIHTYTQCRCFVIHFSISFCESDSIIQDIVSLSDTVYLVMLFIYINFVHPNLNDLKLFSKLLLFSYV